MEYKLTDCENIILSLAEPKRKRKALTFAKKIIGKIGKTMYYNSPRHILLDREDLIELNITDEYSLKKYLDDVFSPIPYKEDNMNKGLCLYSNYAYTDESLRVVISEKAMECFFEAEPAEKLLEKIDSICLVSQNCYAARMYLLLKKLSYGKHSLTFSEIKKFMKCENVETYLKPQYFKRVVVKDAIDLVNDKTELMALVDTDAYIDCDPAVTFCVSLKK